MLNQAIPNSQFMTDLIPNSSHNSIPNGIKDIRFFFRSQIGNLLGSTISLINDYAPLISIDRPLEFRCKLFKFLNKDSK